MHLILTAAEVALIMAIAAAFGLAAKFAISFTRPPQ